MGLHWFTAKEEKSRNRVLATKKITLQPDTLRLHQSLFIADLHSDSLLWNRNLSKKSDYGHVDIPRLIEGNIGLQVFSVVTKSPKNLNLNKNSSDTDNITKLALAQLWPPKTWFSLYQRAHYQANKLHKLAKGNDNFYLIKNQQEFKNYLQMRNNDSKVTAGLLSLEGAHALEGRLENLHRLYKAGFRIIGFAHFFDNKLGGSAHGIRKAGITEFGKQVLQQIDELEMFVDISHASPALIKDIFALSNRPILATHTGVQAVCSSNRNLSDEQIRLIAKSGGLVGIGFWPIATCGKNIDGIIQSIRHVSNLVGIEYVALGSDFDGNVLVPFTSSGIAQLTNALVIAGFNKDQISKLMGGNIERLFTNYLPKI